MYLVNYVGTLDAFYKATQVSLRLRRVARTTSSHGKPVVKSSAITLSDETDLKLKSSLQASIKMNVSEQLDV